MSEKELESIPQKHLEGKIISLKIRRRICLLENQKF